MQLSFIVRLLAIVSTLSRYRYDIFISPSHILCGQDVLSTHQFLRALAASSLSRPDEMNEIVDSVLEEDDASLYKRAVRTRASIKRFQAVFRGWLVRKQCIDKQNSKCESCQQNSIDSPNDSRSNSSIIDQEKAKKEAQAAIDELTQSYHEVISRKSKAEDELKSTEDKLKTENDKLVRVLNIASKHKKQSRKPVQIMSLPRIRPPHSAPNSKTKRNARSLSNSEITSYLPPVDEAFVERITNLAITERTAKSKAKRNEEREQVLKQKLLRSKQKESELKLQEQRITDLADKIRRQQLQLKEQKLQFEQSKLTAPQSPRPDSTSRPCSLCTEKEMHLRDMKEKVKRRMKILSQREAQVIGKAHELRRREIQLLKLQNEESEPQQNVKAIEPHASKFTQAKTGQMRHQVPIVPMSLKLQNEESEPQQNVKAIEPHAHASKFTQAKTGQMRHQKESTTTIITSTTHKRKRISGSDEKGQEPKLPQHIQNKDKLKPVLITAGASVKSIRSSFDESVPTIHEEPHQLSDGENSSVETFHSEETPHSEDALPEARGNSFKVEIDKESCARKREAIKPMKVPTLNESVNRSNGVTIAISSNKRQCSLSKSKTQSPAKQRHIFTFEKKKQHITNPSQIITRESGSRQSTSRGSKRDRREEDDWISSFDGQMKCAMSKLKELV